MRRQLERAVEEVTGRSVEPQRGQAAAKAPACSEQRLGRQPVHVRRQATHVDVVVEVEVNGMARQTGPAVADLHAARSRAVHTQTASSVTDRPRRAACHCLTPSRKDLTAHAGQVRPWSCSQLKERSESTDPALFAPIETSRRVSSIRLSEQRHFRLIWVTPDQLASY